MNIKEILAKIAKKEEFTEDELQFLSSYDPQKDIDTASAAARRDGEKKAKEALSKQAELAKQIEELQAKLTEKEEAGKTASEDFVKLQKRLKTIEEKYAASEAKLAANARMDAIVELAKANGIHPAEGIAGTALEKLLDLAVGQTDVTDEDAMKAVFEQFKSENPAMIRAAVKGGVNVKGEQSQNSFAGVPNPWKPESLNLTKQIEISMANSELAAKMKSEAGVS